MRLYENFHIGNLTKSFCMFKTSFWLNDGFSGEVVGNGGPSFVRGCEKGPASIFSDATTSLGTPALVAFIAGKNSDQWMAKGEAEIKAAILAQLESYFGRKVRDEFMDFYIKDWTTEPNLRGGPVNILSPGQMHNFYALRTPHKNVHFAGTATSTEWCGYLSGAVQSGYRAVAEVLQTLDPKSVTAEDKALVKRAHPDGYPNTRVAWKPKYSGGKWINHGFVLGLAFGLVLMHPRLKVLDLVRTWLTNIRK
jgi:monoamine oxidase